MNDDISSRYPHSNHSKREKPKDHLELNPDEYKYIVGVKYTKAAIQGYFYTNIEKLHQCSKIIIKTVSGLESGIICSTPQLISEVGIQNSEISGAVEREQTMSDKNIINHIHTQKEPEEMEYCRQRIRSREMKMKLVCIEHLFSGEKIIFYFIADGRVDFRELVKDLARRYRTRIEMRQIGVRDEAKMLSDYEHCGRELCCRTFINDLEPVTMRMAKMQKTTLDPSKISGHCGRLMCCLRFEDDVYKSHKSQLPRKGDRVATKDFSGCVMNTHILSKDIQICCDDGSVETINLKDVIDHELNQKKHRSKSAENSSEDDGNSPDPEEPCCKCHCANAADSDSDSDSDYNDQEDTPENSINEQ